MLIDSHCHLASRRFATDPASYVKRAEENGVERIIAIGTDLDDSAACVDLAERFSGVYATTGIHPTSVTELDDPGWLQKIATLAAHPKVVAIGELGLDFYHNPPKGWTFDDYSALQRDVLRRQLDLAAQLGKNVVVHTRNSIDDTIEIVGPYAGALRAVFHCFVDPWKTAAPLIEDGHVVSFTGIATYNSAAVVHDTATRVPAGHFMVETDAPYLTPVPFRGKPNEPAYVRYTAEAIARLRGETVDALAAYTTHTAKAFFGIP